MKLNFQQFYIDLQDELIEMYEVDEDYAKRLKETIDKVKKKQKVAERWCDEY